MEEHMACPTDDQLANLATGKLDRPRAEPIEKHIVFCPPCRARYARMPSSDRHYDVPEAGKSTADLDIRDLAVDLSSIEPPVDTFELRRAVNPLSHSIAGYEILRELHRGGQGVVYLANQKATRRRVAVKVMREGPFAGPRDRARFEREVQILATLNHPNIVAIHDSGMSAGSFYFVMDYISGQPLDEYMAGASRTTREILGQFLKICNAVNAAHLRGVIHRDLKPSNIRIDTEGEPHVLDFGLAKMVFGSMTDDSGQEVMTVTGQFVGSLPWASPEQAEGVPARIDVRTDVYSLGVILYQMLTGRFPYQVTGNMRAVLDEIIRVEPTPPSTHRRDIDDEISTIVLKCLAKDRDRRYQTAGELGRDISRYLAGEAIEAKRDSLGYLVRKQLRRYRLPAAVAAAFVVLIAVGLVTSLTFWRQAVHDRDAAQRETHRAQQAEQSATEQRQSAEKLEAQAQREARKAVTVREFMQDMLASARPTAEGGGREVKVVDVLEHAAEGLGEKFNGQPELEMHARRTLGDTYIALGLYKEAAGHLEHAQRLATTALGAEHQETLALSGRLAWARYEDGRLDQAESLARESLTAARRALGPDHETTCELANALAVTLNYQRKLDEAETLYRELIDTIRRRERQTNKPEEFASILHNLAWVLRQKGDLGNAESMQRQALVELDREQAAGSTVLRYRFDTNLAGILERRGRLAEAEDVFRQTLAEQRRILGDKHPDVRQLIRDYARVLERLGRLDEALVLRQDILSATREKYEGDHEKTAQAISDLGHLLGRAGRLDEAAGTLQEAIAMRRRLHGDSDQSARQCWRQLVIQRGLGPASGWKSLTLRRHTFDLLDRVLAAQPTQTFSLDEYSISTLAFKIAPWEGRADAPVIGGDLAQLKALEDPRPGIHALAIEMERTSGDIPVRETAWMLAAPWRLHLFTFEDTRQISRSQWASLVAAEPVERKMEAMLSLSNEWDCGLGPAGRYDHFGIVAHTTVNLPAGPYRIMATSDDGVRVSLADHLAIDSWTNRETTLDTAQVTLGGGPHELRVDYFQAGGPARLIVQLVPLSGEAVGLLATLLDEEPEAMSGRAMEDGQLSQQEERLAEAEDAYRRALDILETLPKSKEEKQAPVVQALARVLARQGKHAQSIEFYRRSLILHERYQGSSEPATLWTKRDLARELSMVGGDGVNEAIDLCSTVVDNWGRIRGPMDEESLQAMMDLVLVSLRADRQEKATAVRSAMLDLARAAAARRDPQSPQVTYRIAQIMERQPDAAPIEEAFQIAYETARAVWGEDSFEATHRLHGMAAAQRRLGKLAEAEAAYRLSLQIRSRVMGSRNPEVTWALQDLAYVLADAGRFDEAENLCREIVDIRGKVWGSGNDETIIGILQLADILAAGGERDEAEQWLRKAVEYASQAHGELHARTCEARRRLGSYLLAEARLEDAEKELLAAQKGLRAAGAPAESAYRRAMEDLQRLYERWGKPQLAAEWRDKLTGPEVATGFSSVSLASPAANQ